jgi:hypothetical protein
VSIRKGRTHGFTRFRLRLVSRDACARAKEIAADAIVGGDKIIRT